MLYIINEAAAASRSALPGEHIPGPYMLPEKFDAELARGVRFLGYAADGVLIGVVGIEAVRNVILIRHAFVVPGFQGRGVGGKLLQHVMGLREAQYLAGTWTDAIWSVRFYRRYGFRPASPTFQRALLEAFWGIPEPMADRSVALAHPPLSDRQAGKLISQP